MAPTAIQAAEILRRDAEGVVLSVRESVSDKQTTYIERRNGAGQFVWRHKLPGLPAQHTALNVIAVEGKADLTLLAMFNPTDSAPGASFAQFIDVDMRGGALRDCRAQELSLYDRPR